MLSSPTYFLVANIFKERDAKLIWVPITSEGFDVEYVVFKMRETACSNLPLQMA